jgi:hypothetical protein
MIEYFKNIDENGIDVDAFNKNIKKNNLIAKSR